MFGSINTNAGALPSHASSSSKVQESFLTTEVAVGNELQLNTQQPRTGAHMQEARVNTVSQ